MPAYWNSGAYSVFGLEGLTSGTALTGAAGHGGNSGCTWIAPASAGSVTASTAAASAGSMGYKFTTTTSGISDGRFESAASNLIQSSRFDGFYFSALPTTEMRVALLRNATATVGYLVIDTTGRLKIYDTATPTPNQTTLTTALTPGTKYDIACEMTAASSTTGAALVRVYTAKTSTALFSPSTVTGLNFAITALTGWDFGVANAQANMTVGVGNIQFQTGTAVLMPPLLRPVASFTGTPTGLVLALDATASTGGTSGGPTITSYAWNFGDSSTGSGVTTSHTYASGGSKTVSLTLTDTIGLTQGPSSNSYTVTAPSLTGLVANVTSAGGFTVVNAADIPTAVTDNDSTSWGISGVSPSSAELKLRLNPLPIPAAGTNLTVSVQADAVTATSGGLVVKLYQGATTIATLSSQSLTVVADGSTMTHTLTYTILPASWAAVTDWTALDLGLVATAA